MQHSFQVGDPEDVALASGRSTTTDNTSTNGSIVDVENFLVVDDGDDGNKPSLEDNVHSLPTVAEITGKSSQDLAGVPKQQRQRRGAGMSRGQKVGIGVSVMLFLGFLSGILLFPFLFKIGKPSTRDTPMMYGGDENERFGNMFEKDVEFVETIENSNLGNEFVAIPQKTDPPVRSPIATTQVSSPTVVTTTLTPQDPAIPQIVPGPNNAAFTDNVPALSRREAIVQYLTVNQISTEANLLREFSPQHKAVEWIAKTDERQLIIPDTSPTTKDGYMFVARYILAVVYYSMGGIYWTDSLNFLSKDSICDWFSLIITEKGLYPRGVACDDNEIIDALFLDSNNLSEEIPREMGLLTTLNALNLDINIITGYIPTTFTKMTALKHLTMAHNKLSGNLPEDIDELSMLESIDLSYNYLENTLPPSMSQMRSLNALAIDNNIITGEIDTIINFGGVPGIVAESIEFLYAEDNNFTDTLSDQFFKGLNKLLRLDLSGNVFDGTLPIHLFELPLLEVLDLHDNFITGTLPGMLAVNTQLKFMSLQKNKIRGPIPPRISKFKEGLYHLDLSDNSLTGTIATDLAELSRLTYLFLAKNDFTPGPIPTFLGQLTGLMDLSLKGTQRNGPIPDFVGEQLTKLVLLDLDDNKLQGPIPDSMKQLVDLQFVLLNGNLLSGTVPTWFGDLKSLRMLFIDTNNLKGTELNSTFCNLGENQYLPYLVADCKGPSPEIACDCCFKCCEDSEVCNDDDMIPSNDPTWQFGYQRLFYTFGDRVSFFSFP